MMDAALIINGVVDTVYRNMAAADLPEHPDGQWFDAPAGEVFGGYLYEDGSFSAPHSEPEPDPVPEVISDRQFFHALAVLGMITEAEALAAVKTGDPPAAMDAFLSALPDDQEFGARMLLEGATTFQRSHPLTLAFAAGMNMTAEQTDDLWRLAASL